MVVVLGEGDFVTFFSGWGAAANVASPVAVWSVSRFLDKFGVDFFGFQAAIGVA